jgi:uncharacterized lipoprotein YddW (UPF0748 family)
MDDYFYPYPSYNNNIDFPDSVSWTAYQQSGGKLSRGDWRRDAVNQLIKRMYENVKAHKPWVKFGISPFGIWRPGFPESIGGFDQYDQLYADAKLWLNEGWVDYFAPQLYWPVNRYAQSYPVLLGWWGQENKKNRHLWPGISVGRDTSDKSLDETINEIMIDRGMQPQSKGVIHWSISSVTGNPRLADTLIKSIYRKQALVPASPWLDNKSPDAPEAKISDDEDPSLIKVTWTHSNSKDIFHWIVYYKIGENWAYRILPSNEMSARIERLNLAPMRGKTNRIIVTAVDRTGNESEMKEIEVK